MFLLPTYVYENKNILRGKLTMLLLRVIKSRKRNHISRGNQQETN